MIRIGQFDADELKIMKADETLQKLIKSKRVELCFQGYDCGEVWVNEGDGEAFAKASRYVQ
jgi:hypothetical protein